MKAMAWTDWRRWIATLCVALVAFVMVEQSFSSDPCHGGAPVSYNIAKIALVAESGDERHGSPATPPQSQHHCCAAHPIAVPPLHLAQAIDQVTIRLSAPLSDMRAPNGEQGGQDRPPRMSATV
ncbi:MAG: hypothetical protein NW206_18240 [Hyphomonadaceae bacterium]|nr:hypothetical protein [Hyphomonadaceae bacterium]